MPTTSGTPSIFCCGFPCPHVWTPTASYEGLSPPWFFWSPFGCWYLFSLLEVCTSSLGHACNALYRSSSTHAQYVGLNQYFSHPSLVIYFSQPHP
jgi:hypothetical protein